MKKVFFLLINIISAIVAIITLCLIRLKFPEGNFIGILNSPIYEQTDDYYSLIDERINDVFTLINLKIPFEHEGSLNYDKVIAESIDAKGALTKWTIGECLSLSVDHGFYIDSIYNVNRLTDATVIPFDKNNRLNFLLKTYPSNLRVGSSTEEEFLTEIMNALSDYYRCNDHLDNNKSNFYYKIIFTNVSNDATIEYKNSNLQNNDYLNSSAFIYVSSKDGIISSNIVNINKDLMKRIKKNNPYPDKDFSFYCMVDTNYAKIDAFKVNHDSYNTIKQECGLLITISIVSMTLFIMSLFIVLYYIFSSKRSVEESQNFFNSISADFYLLVYIIALIAAYFIANRFIVSKTLSKTDTSTIKIYIYVLIIYVFTIILFAALSAKHSNGTLNFIMFNMNKGNDNTISPNLPPAATLFIMFIPTIIFSIISFVLIYLYTLTAYKPLIYIGVILFIATISFIIYLLLLHNSFKKALDSQVKANDMRVTLIANVSHDIKTPLTSIINYTGLMTSEIEKPTKNFKKNLVHYSDIVNEKTNRLNDLINELIFESKVSTGNVNLEMQPIDTITFMSQIISEFKDRLRENGLKIIFEHNTDKAMITADNKQLYRVFQNLFSNVYKYALEKSRVYVDIISEKNRITITIKNIQKEKLEVDVNSLKDRFVRGSKSRTTEGFGLGLSISENLIKSMGGRLDIKNVRDEFITVIKFIPYND